MKSAFLLISSFLLVAAVHGSAVLETRTDDDYVQDESGNASFSIYSNCGSPGKFHKACLQRARAERSTPCSVRPIRNRLYGRDEPAFLRCSGRLGSRGCVRTVLPVNRHCGPDYGSPGHQQHRGESYRSVLRQHAILRSDGLQRRQHAQPADPVRDLPRFSLSLVAAG